MIAQEYTWSLLLGNFVNQEACLEEQLVSIWGPEFIRQQMFITMEAIACSTFLYESLLNRRIYHYPGTKHVL